MPSASTVCALAFAATAAAVVSVAAQSSAPALVQIVHRHGDRAPIKIPPALQADWTATGIGPGELSLIGKQQLRAFGRLLRSRYVDGIPGQQPGILNPTAYDYRQLLVRSSDVDRTLQSVTELLSTLYPGQSVPVHTVPQEWDNVLQATDHCASYVSAYDATDNALSAAWYQDGTNATIAALLNACYLWTGWTPEFARTYEGGISAWLAMVADNYVCAQAHGIPTLPQLDAQAALLRDLHRQYNYANFGPDTADPRDDPRGAVGSELGATLLANIAATISGANTQRKMFVYSAHDDTITSVYSALGLLQATNFAPNGDPLTPPYAMSVVIEYYAPDQSGQSGHVSTYYGLPVRNTSVPDPTAPDAWSYALHGLSVPCGPTEAWYAPPWQATTCAWQYVAPVIRSVIKPAGAGDGCCLRASGWESSACDSAYDTPTSAQTPSCALYRQWCPATACDDGQILTYDSQVCVTLSPSDAAVCWRWLVLGLAFSVLVALGVWLFLRPARKAAAADAAAAASASASATQQPLLANDHHHHPHPNAHTEDHKSGAAAATAPAAQPVQTAHTINSGGVVSAVSGSAGGEDAGVREVHSHV